MSQPTTTRASRPGADSSAPLPQFSIFDDDEVRTVVRRFAPKRPARVAVDVSDADATWKWTVPRADAQGTFAGLALPTLDDDQALEFDHAEVEATQERATPFALTARSSIPLVRRSRTLPRVAKPAPKRAARAAKVIAAITLALACGAGLALAATTMPTVHRATQHLQGATP